MKSLFPGIPLARLCARNSQTPPTTFHLGALMMISVLQMLQDEPQLSGGSQLPEWQSTGSAL